MRKAEESHILRLEGQLRALTEVAKTLTLPFDLPELLNAVLDKISTVLDSAEAGAIMLWDQPAGLFRARAAYGYDLQALKEIGLRAGESITGKVYDQGKACLLGHPAEVSAAMADMREANRRIFRQALRSECLPSCCLAAPLIVGKRKYGVLVLETLTRSVQFRQEDIPFVQSIADLIALAIDRARLGAEADIVREVQQAERLRSEVMAALSHQLRMPLSAIKGYSTALLLEEIKWGEEKRQEFLQLIDEETDSMQAMITELLDSALIDVGQLSVEKQPVRLQHLASDIALEVQRRTEMHRLMLDFSPDFPVVDADPRWIKQVFRNILDNSIKYSPQGGLIVIRGEVRTNDIVISVADQGIGISPEDLIPLFEKFFRAHQANGAQVSGTGLGLPVARAIVEAHQGHIWAESKLGQGTTLYFTLPLEKQPVGADG